MLDWRTSKKNMNWKSTVAKFIEENPEFKPYARFAPEYPWCPIPYNNVRTLYDTVMHYICSSGVRYTYAFRQWQFIHALLKNCTTWEERIERLQSADGIQPKKIKSYVNVCTWMKEHDIEPNDLTLEHVCQMKKEIHGIGDGCVAHCYRYFSDDNENCVEYTDIFFKKGMEVIYGKHKPSFRKQKAEEWKRSCNARIANLMVLNVSELWTSKMI